MTHIAWKCFFAYNRVSWKLGALAQLGARFHVYSLSKAELQQLYLEALIEEEERRNRYW